MTYCLGIILPSGLILASDSRSSAGVDQIALVKKLNLFQKPGERVIAILSAGNLATTQAVVTTLQQQLDLAKDSAREAVGFAKPDIMSACTMFDVAQIVGDQLRAIIQENKSYVQAYGDPDASFLVGGQIKGEPHRLFQVYSAGNFVEATARTRFFQLGETKYGKPILDRALHATSELDEAAKLALLSFDATIRSNLSVAPPIDMLTYVTDSFSAASLALFDTQNAYWNSLQEQYSDGLSQLVRSLPPPAQDVISPTLT
ncbi:MAG: peptidase [Beijerinckiaceae bacterium]|nr:peptidase [Beijerinckiaceae bacterium]